LALGLALYQGSTRVAQARVKARVRVGALPCTYQGSTGGTPVAMLAHTQLIITYGFAACHLSFGLRQEPATLGRWLYLKSWTNTSWLVNQSNTNAVWCRVVCCFA
jgi:hypothetical protein